MLLLPPLHFFCTSCYIDQERADAPSYLVANLPIDLWRDMLNPGFPPEPYYCVACKGGGMIVVFNEFPNFIPSFKKPQTRKADKEIYWRHIVHLKVAPIVSSRNVGALSAGPHHIAQPVEPRHDGFVLPVFLYQLLYDL
jgi:hypothetical protein